MINLKNKLKQFRFMNGELTQQELAEKVSVSRQTIIAIEKGKFNPSMRLALLITRVFKVNVEEIFYLEEI
ncbi:MAG: helix-turn-helix transcriptional regulator [Candidatus Tenebribacter davisii]|nr:helix-turn-helix transcriptional regulator [Candidatus Tenebribacter davisii]